MANRLFLTLLALLTGLAAQIAPAQARVCAEQSAEVALCAPAAQRAQAAPAGLARLPAPGWRHAKQVAGVKGDTRTQVRPVASVLIGIDRARE